MQKGLIVGNLSDTVVEWLIDPFHFFEKKIKRRLGLKLTYSNAETFEEIDLAIKENQPDILFFTVDWSVPVDNAVAFLAALNERPDRPRMVFLDYYDQCTTPFFPLMPYVDLYVRKQLLRNVGSYNELSYRGKNNISDFISRQYDIDLGDWEFGSKIPEGCEDKLMTGWNLATANTLSRPYRYPILRKIKRPAAKKLDVTCRTSLYDEDVRDNSYYFVHRSNCLKAVQSLENKFKVGHNANGERISYRAFKREMRQSRLAVSPFGWGEVTDRDFAIVNAGTLLVKPDMSHLQTEPDIYRAGETYVPVKWDFSDLEEVCEYYLSHPAETREITENAIHVYDEYYRQAKFVDKIEEILQRLDNS